jgi:ubiquinone biosynthesis protein
MEAAAASELRDNFKKPGSAAFKFYVPKIYWQYVSRNVLVIEKVGGIKIDQRDELIKAGHNPDDILALSARALFKQVFDDGFFHADLHPGNVFINPRGEIVPIDFGIMGRLDKQSRIYIAEILAGFLTKDYYKVAKAHFDAGYVPKEKSIDNFAMACRAVGEPVMDLPINEISVARLLAHMFSVAEDFEMITQPHLLLLQKTMMMAEGVGRALNPNVNMWKLAEPLVRDWAQKNMGVKAQVRNKLEDAKDLVLQLNRILNLAEVYLAKKV